MRPMTAAASTRSSSPLLAPDTPWKLAKPTSGTRNNTAVADSIDASAHTIVESRRTGMPSRLARSSFSAAARTPMP